MQNYRAHFEQSVVSKSNVYAILGADRQATLAEDVELTELRAKHFIENMPSKQFTIVGNKDRKAEIESLICFPPKNLPCLVVQNLKAELKHTPIAMSISSNDKA